MKIIKEKSFIFSILCILMTIFILNEDVLADVTINVTKPSDWNGLAVQAWNDELGDITTWPGVKLIKQGSTNIYSYTLKVDSSQKIIIRLNDDGGGKQTVQIDGINNSKGLGLEAGCYDITIGKMTNSGKNEYTYNIIKTIKKPNFDVTKNTTNKAQVKTPSTSDNFLVFPLIVIIVILSWITIKLYRQRIVC